MAGVRCSRVHEALAMPTEALYEYCMTMLGLPPAWTRLGQSAAAFGAVLAAMPNKALRR